MGCCPPMYCNQNSMRMRGRESETMERYCRGAQWMDLASERFGRSACRGKKGQLLTSVYDGERLELADPAALAVVPGDHQAQGALVGAEVLAVGRVGYQDGFVGEVNIQFGEGEGRAIAVAALG